MFFQTEHSGKTGSGHLVHLAGWCWGWWEGKGGPGEWGRWWVGEWERLGERETPEYWWWWDPETDTVLTKPALLWHQVLIWRLCSNMGVSSLIWVRMSDMEVGYLVKVKVQGGGGGVWCKVNGQSRMRRWERIGCACAVRATSSGKSTSSGGPATMWVLTSFQHQLVKITFCCSSSLTL